MTFAYSLKVTNNTHQETIRIATRQSPLALWQAEHVADCLRNCHDDLRVEIIPISTKGDKILDTPLAKIGGKGLFVKELELAMRDGRADIAAHSMKDLPAELPEDLMLGAILRREDPRDALISPRYGSLDQLPPGARVGTCSLRRQCQLLSYRPDLQLLDLRGNVGTRLAKLDSGNFDAIILATAGVKRLNLQDRIAEILPPERSLPAIGQGAIGIECRYNDSGALARIAALNDPSTVRAVQAERAMNARLDTGCQAPVAGFAQIQEGKFRLLGLVGMPDGTMVLRVQKELILADELPTQAEVEELGQQVAESLLAQGADEILANLSKS